MTNSSRILSEVVSLEAWYTPLQPDCRSPFHVALGFAQARYAGTDKTPVEFKVRLKRATLVVLCDPNLRVPRDTKERQYPRRQRNIKTVDQTEASASTAKEKHLTGKMTADPTKPLSGEAETGKKNSASTTEKSAGQHEIQESVEQSIELTYREVQGEHHWDCKPLYQDFLDGPGHTGSEPLMEITPLVTERLNDLSVRVFLKCAAEDFDITEISAKKSVKEQFLGEDLARRLKLAKEVIKHKLAEAQLDVVELDPRFQQVVIADVLALPE